MDGGVVGVGGVAPARNSAPALVPARPPVCRPPDCRRPISARLRLKRLRLFNMYGMSDDEARRCLRKLKRQRDHPVPLDHGLIASADNQVGGTPRSHTDVDHMHDTSCAVYLSRTKS
mgnify:CR=1 FL=1